METILRKVGGSTMLAVPPALLDILHLKPNSTVSLSIENGSICIRPVLKKQYELSDLLALCDASSSETEEDKIWLNGSAVGEEIL